MDSSNGFIEVNQINDFNSYIRSIDFSDPFIWGLCTFHLLALLLILSTRHFANVQIGIFLSLLSMVYFSEYLNELAAQKWKLFSRQQYFDSNGMFVSIVFSMPILINCILLIGFWLYESTQTMARLKKAQILATQRQPATAAVKEKEKKQS